MGEGAEAHDCSMTIQPAIAGICSRLVRQLTCQALQQSWAVPEAHPVRQGSRLRWRLLQLGQHWVAPGGHAGAGGHRSRPQRAQQREQVRALPGQALPLRHPLCSQPVRPMHQHQSDGSTADMLTNRNLAQPFASGSAS